MAGTYVGYDQPRMMSRSGTRGSMVFPIFVEYAKSAFQTYPPDDFEVSGGISFMNMNQTGGHLVRSGRLWLPFYTDTEPGPSMSEETISGVNTRNEDLLEQTF